MQYALIGAGMEIHRHLGPGFLKSVYQETFCIELQLLNIPFIRDKRLVVHCDGIQLKKNFCVAVLLMLRCLSGLKS